MSPPEINPADDHPKSAPVPPNPKPTLLVVDDEDGPRQSIRFVFKDDYNILMAENGQVALDLVRGNEINVAVLDIRMPGISGIDVLKALKELSPDTEVLMLTAFETLDTARQALRLGARDYLNKPFDIPTLRDAVKKAFERNAVAREIHESSERLRELQDEIYQQRMREEEARKRGDIYASIIHDINGPLTVISGFIDTITKGIGDAPSIEGDKLDIIRDRLNRINRQVTSCVEISRRYLSFLHTRGNDASHVSVAQVLADLEKLFQHRKVAAHNRLTVAAPPSDLVASINGIDLLQILINLAINALESSQAGVQVEIRAERLDGPLDPVRLQNETEHRFLPGRDFSNQLPLLAVSVTDTGPGIPPEVLARLFEPYFTTKPPGKGTGLGLSIVQRLVEHSKGAIEVSTRLGHGTSFTVVLPARVSSRS